VGWQYICFVRLLLHGLVMHGSNPRARVLPMSSEEFAVRVSGLGKCYHMYAKPEDRLRQFLLPKLSRIIGKTSRNYFREFWALSDVSFNVKKGECFGAATLRQGQWLPLAGRLCPARSAAMALCTRQKRGPKACQLGRIPYPIYAERLKSS
jgi:hypothetical protein